MSISIFFFLFALFLASLCRAQDVTLYLNDTRFSTSPPNWWGGQDFQPLCGGTRWTSASGQNISLTFIGVSITVNFIAETRGAIALITINGTNVAQVSTFKPDVLDTDCVPQSWSSGPLSAGRHVIAVTQLGAGDPAYASIVYVWMRSFVYTPPPTVNATATSSVLPPHSSKHSVPIGAVAGGVGAGVVLLIATVSGILVLCRRRNRGRDLPERMDLISGTGGDNFPIVPPAPAPAFPTPSFPTPEGHLQSSGVNTNYNYDRSGMQSLVPPMLFTATSQRPRAVSSGTAPYAESLPSGMSSSHYSDATKNQQAPLLNGKATLHPANPSSDTPEPQRLSETQLQFLQRLAEQNVPGPALATVIQSMTNPNRDSAAVHTSSIMSTIQPGSPRNDPPPEYNFKGE